MISKEVVPNQMFVQSEEVEKNSLVSDPQLKSKKPIEVQKDVNSVICNDTYFKINPESRKPQELIQQNEVNILVKPNSNPVY